MNEKGLCYSFFNKIYNSTLFIVIFLIKIMINLIEQGYTIAPALIAIVIRFIGSIYKKIM